MSSNLKLKSIILRIIQGSSDCDYDTTTAINRQQVGGGSIKVCLNISDGIKE